jgi:hypothetical protein
MKRGFCYHAEHREPSEALESIIETLGSVGITLTHPRDGRITHLVGDGEAVVVTKDELVGGLAGRPSLTAQLWLSPDAYVACALRRLDSAVVRHFYSLDGLDTEERHRLLEWAVNYFRRAVREDAALLMIADEQGRTADVDWDGVAREVCVVPSILPDALGLPSTWAAGAHFLLAPEREQIGRFELLKRPGSAI